MGCGRSAPIQTIEGKTIDEAMSIAGTDLIMNDIVFVVEMLCFITTTNTTILQTNIRNEIINNKYTTIEQVKVAFKTQLMRLGKPLTVDQANLFMDVMSAIIVDATLQNDLSDYIKFDDPIFYNNIFNKVTVYPTPSLDNAITQVLAIYHVVHDASGAGFHKESFINMNKLPNVVTSDIKTKIRLISGMIEKFENIKSKYTDVRGLYFKSKFIQSDNYASF